LFGRSGSIHGQSGEVYVGTPKLLDKQETHQSDEQPTQIAAVD
jgi:hypothetical protein